MENELIEMIEFLFNELNKKIEFKILQPTQNISQSNVRESDFDYLGKCITETLKPKLGHKFKIGADGIWTFWSEKKVGIQKTTPKILAAYFFVIYGIEKIEELPIIDSRVPGRKIFGKNYWEKYENWYKQRLTDESLIGIEYISIETEGLKNKQQEGIEYRLVNESYWQELLKTRITNSEMFSYYLDTNSSERLLPHIVANGYYIPKQRLAITADDSHEKSAFEIKIKEFFNKGMLPKSMLLKILGEGGEGKSTFLLHMAKEFCSEFNVLYFKINHSIDKLLDVLPKFDNTKPLMILIDDVRNHRERLEDYSESLKTRYPDTNYVVLLAERTDRYKVNTFFEENFDKVYTTNYKFSSLELGLLFDKFWECLCSIHPTEINAVSANALTQYKNAFIDSSKTVCDRIEELFICLGISHTLRKRLEEWDDWNANVKSDNFSEIRNLYTITALFYKFGIPVPIKYFKPTTQSLIIDALVGEDRISSAIILDDENFLKLRHETKADKYFKHNARKIETYFDYFLDHVDNKEAAKLFRNLYVHPEFKTLSFLTGYLKPERCELILRKYLAICDDVEERGKTTIYLCRSLLLNQEINLRNKRVRESIELLDNLIKDDRKNLQARSTLSSLQITLKNPSRSYELLNQILQIDQNNIEALVNLIVLYSETDTPNSKFEDLLSKRSDKDEFKHHTYLQVARRFFGGKRLIYATALLEFYVSNFLEAEADYLLEKAYRKIRDLKSFEDKIYILRGIGNLLKRMHRKGLMGEKKNDGSRIKLVELFMEVDEWKLAKAELSYIPDKEHTNFQLLNARISANQGNFRSAYLTLNSLFKKEPLNPSVLVPLIKVCKNYFKLIEARRHALYFLTIKPDDIDVANLYINILFDEIGAQSGRFKIAERRILTTRGVNGKQETALQYILSALYYMWATKTTKSRSYVSTGDNNASRHFSTEMLKLAIETLPSDEIYTHTKNRYLETMQEIKNETL